MCTLDAVYELRAASGKEGHHISFDGPHAFTDLVCWKCGGKGHTRYDCQSNSREDSPEGQAAKKAWQSRRDKFQNNSRGQSRGQGKGQGKGKGKGKGNGGQSNINGLSFPAPNADGVNADALPVPAVQSLDKLRSVPEDHSEVVDEQWGSTLPQPSTWTEFCAKLNKLRSVSEGQSEVEGRQVAYMRTPPANSVATKAAQSKKKKKHHAPPDPPVCHAIKSDVLSTPETLKTERDLWASNQLEMLREAKERKKEKEKIQLESAQRETQRYYASQVGVVSKPGVYDSLYDDASDYPSESESDDDPNDGSLNCSSLVHDSIPVDDPYLFALLNPYPDDASDYPSDSESEDDLHVYYQCTLSDEERDAREQLAVSSHHYESVGVKSTWLCRLTNTSEDHHCCSNKCNFREVKNVNQRTYEDQQSKDPVSS